MELVYVGSPSQGHLNVNEKKNLYFFQSILNWFTTPVCVSSLCRQQKIQHKYFIKNTHKVLAFLLFSLLAVRFIIFFVGCVTHLLVFLVSYLFARFCVVVCRFVFCFHSCRFVFKLDFLCFSFLFVGFTFCLSIRTCLVSCKDGIYDSLKGAGS